MPLKNVPPFLLPNIIPVTVAFAALLFNSQNRVIPSPESRHLVVPKLVPFLVPFWCQFWPQNGPQNGPKICPKIDNFGVHFWIPFLLGFGALWVSLGSPVGPPKALLGGLWTPQTLKNCGIFKVFANTTFWVFGALDGLLGPILAHSWADLVPK